MEEATLSTDPHAVEIKKGATCVLGGASSTRIYSAATASVLPMTLMNMLKKIWIVLM